MKKVIFSQVMTDNGTAEFSGVYDRNGLPVKIILEADDDGIVLTAVRRKLTDLDGDMQQRRRLRKLHFSGRLR